jgi:hypothetical protein
VPDIRYVCISDLHLGADNSVLTHLAADGTRADGPSPLLVAVLDGLRDLLRRSGTPDPPTLVVHGDLFELALTTTDVAADTFGHLVRAVWGHPDDPLFDDAPVFVPGNHDHHLWEMTREHQYEDYLRRSLAEAALSPMPHVTPMRLDRFSPIDHEPFVSLLARRALHATGPTPTVPTFRIVYPNLGLADLDPDLRGETPDHLPDRAVIVTHGQYVEPMYRAMSFLHNVVTPARPPRLDIAELEGDNWAWIDFFWSTMGRSGEDQGPDAEAIPVLYELLHSEKAMDAIVDRVLDDLLPRTRSVVRGLERWGLRRIGRRAVGAAAQRERLHAAVLSPAATTGLTRYLDHPVRTQLDDELGGVPRRVDLVFGHTHKPFAGRRQPAGYPGPVIAHNTGGWVVDAPHPEPVKGAAVTLVDADHHVADLRIYRQEADPSAYRVAVVAVNDPLDEPNPLHDWLTATIDPTAEPWAGISHLAATTVAERQRQLTDRIARGTRAVQTVAPTGPRGW